MKHDRDLKQFKFVLNKRRAEILPSLGLIRYAYKIINLITTRIEINVQFIREKR